MLKEKNGKQEIKQNKKILKIRCQVKLLDTIFYIFSRFLQGFYSTDFKDSAIFTLLILKETTILTKEAVTNEIKNDIT
jgi:hypothetical protein